MLWRMCIILVFSIHSWTKCQICGNGLWYVAGRMICALKADMQESLTPYSYKLTFTKQSNYNYCKWYQVPVTTEEMMELTVSTRVILLNAQIESLSSDSDFCIQDRLTLRDSLAEEAADSRVIAGARKFMRKQYTRKAFSSLSFN
ncbi:unnamed protein product [Dovyalis caffra]|uniref:Uncharacterized protein n=1 Tax=Dovyalis caffra TaxID=77055 RepID=A0AAV1S4F3_9ROSI|nr:unnamed protein product [Dovyalis caffra]